MLKSFLNDIEKHSLEYLVLFSGLIIAAFSFFVFAGLPFWRLVIVVSTAVFYFVWGSVHHLLKKDWHLKIALEYLLIAIIGGGLLLSIMLRS